MSIQKKFVLYQSGVFFNGYLGPNGLTQNVSEAYSFDKREDAESMLAAVTAKVSNLANSGLQLEIQEW